MIKLVHVCHFEEAIATEKSKTQFEFRFLTYVRNDIVLIIS